MKSIYIPNLYRADEYRKNEPDTRIAYYQKNMQGEVYKAFQVGITYRLLEQLLYFDRIYIDLIDVPAFLNILNWMDSSICKMIIERGYVSFINSHDISIGVSYNHSKYFGGLAAGKGPHGPVNSADELREFIFLIYNYDKNIDDIIKFLYSNKIDYFGEDFKEIIKCVDADIKNDEIRNKLNLKSASGTTILKKEVPIINALSYATKNIIVSKKIKVENLYMEDIILDIMEARYNQHFSNESVKFNQLLKNFTLPDIELLLFYGKLSLEDLFLLKESKDFNFIKNKILSESLDDREILNSFLDAANKRIQQKDLVFKTISIAISTLVGLLNPLLGLGATSISEVISSIKSNSGHPTLSLSNVATYIKENSKDYNDLPTVLTSRMKKQYIVK